MDESEKRKATTAGQTPPRPDRAGRASPPACRPGDLAPTRSRAVGLDPRLATALAAFLSAAEPVILQWLTSVLASAGTPAEIPPAPGGGVDGAMAYSVAEAAKRAGSLGAFSITKFLWDI